MQREPTETSKQRTQSNASSIFSQSNHGLLHHDAPGLERVRSAESAGSAGSRSASPHSVSDAGRASLAGVDADHLDEKLRGLNLKRRSKVRSPVAGKRITDYEKALTPPTPRQAMGFKVVKRTDTRIDGLQLEDFPNGSSCRVLC